ncbi:uncharacterized protein LOC100185317 [Ciona intestinalis]
MLKQIIRIVVLFVLLAYSVAIGGFNLRISTLDCVHTFTWDGTTTREVKYTIYKLHETYDNQYNSYGEWLPVMGCVDVTMTMCVMKEPLDDFTITHVYMIGDASTNRTKTNVDENKLLYFTPFRDETLRFSALNFQIVRNKSSFLVEFQQKSVGWWGNVTVANYLRDMGFFLTYYVSYYGYDANNDNNHQTPVHSKMLDAIETTLMVTTSVPDDWFLCIQIKITYEEKSDNISSPYTQICSEPVVEFGAVANPIHRWLLPTLLVVAMVSILAAFCFCQPRWKKLYFQIFSIREINIPDFQIESWMNDAQHFDRVDEMKEVPDLIQPRMASYHGPVASYHEPVASYHEPVASYHGWDGNNHDYTNVPPHDDNSMFTSIVTTSSEDEDHDYSRGIFYENKPGPYVTTAAPYVTIEQAFNLQQDFDDKTKKQPDSFYEDICFPAILNEATSLDRL